MEFAIQLKTVRTILGLSQEKIAKELGVSFATINRIETKKTKPSYDTFRKFEDFCIKNNVSCLKGNRG